MDSTLTKFLMDSLTGNSLTSILITASQEKMYVEESISALNFGVIACQVKTKVPFQIELSKEEVMAALEEAEAKLAACQALLKEHGIAEPTVNKGD